jgi:DNA polymerase-1
VPRLFLIDTFGFIFRAYHARGGAPPMHTATGMSTEAVYIFHNMVRKLKETHRPEYLAAVFESLGPTFRDAAYEAYKATRKETPPDLLDQIPWIRRTLEAMRIPILEYESFEADDVIGTLARRAAEQGFEVVIVSSDKDMLQLVSDRVRMLNPMKNDEWYGPAETEKFLGVRPDQVADLLALKGDAIDNIPGAPGIGDKGALELIQAYGSVEGAIGHAAEVKRKTYRESLQNNQDIIRLSKELATIHCNVPIDIDFSQLAVQEPDTEALREIYRTLEFYTLLRSLAPTPRPKAELDYRQLSSESELEAWIATLPAGAPLSVASGALMEQPVLGFSSAPGIARTLFSSKIHPRATVAHDIKTLIRKFGDSPALHHDVMLYAFLLSADPAVADLNRLAERWLAQAPEAEPAAQADAVLSLYQRLRPEVESLKLMDLYEQIDLPLVRVLARMEDCGVRVDPQQLRAMSARLESEIASLTAEIHALAGKPFNVNSPQQLGKILFEDLNLPAPTKMGRGKVISTAADVLEELAEEHEIARKVLEFRQLAKLKGTYIDALPGMMDPDTGRIHTRFNQVGAATGRLSSSDPNLQNIPIRTELGREIRRAFIPREGWKLIVADYSQIELRLLAHMSHDPVLVEAFRHGEDIHTRTAAEVLGIPPLMVTPDQRRRAKAINFGIVYGQTPFGLAQSLGIDQKEAERYIHAYFERYAGVRKFIDSTIAEVRRTGISVNLYGRRRPIPDMQSKNFAARSFAERTAVNTPLQGTAADLIKLAMIRIDGKLRGMQARMLLQVHDELIFEAPPEEVDRVRALVKSEMENVRKLDVPLLVEVGVGDNWRDAK